MLSGGQSSFQVPSVFRTSVYHNTSYQKPTCQITLKLLTFYEEHPIRNLTLPASIGRVSDPRVKPSSRNGLFNSVFLSRHHAYLKMDNGKVVVEDLGSCNGTFVNGVPLKGGESWPLSSGDIIQFGSEDDSGESNLLTHLHCFIFCLDSAIVTEIFFDEQYNTRRPLQSLLNSNHNNDPVPDEDPFVVKSNSHYFRGEHTTTTNSVMTSSSFDVGDALSSKIASISRSLASLCVSLRTQIPPVSKETTENALQTLSSIENTIMELSRDTSMHIISPDLAGEQSTLPTIHQRPTLKAALNIILFYELIFCVMAFLLAVFLFTL